MEGTRRIGRNEKRWFGIGFVPSVLYGFLPELIRQVRGSDTALEVGLSELTTVQQMEALKAGRIDIGFGRIVLDDPAITRTVVMAEPLMAAVPSGHAALKGRAHDAGATGGALLRALSGTAPGPVTPTMCWHCSAPRACNLLRGPGGQRTADRHRPRGRRALGSAWCRHRSSACIATTWPDVPIGAPGLHFSGDDELSAATDRSALLAGQVAKLGGAS
ncbi:LysR substrate-binding domain-containing protein [Cupriavidus basilensis]